MSVAELPPSTARSATASSRVAPGGRRLTLTLEQALYLGLFALALGMHLWGLGDRALHHDETHHANYSWRLFVGKGYIHDPLLHGPFLYHMGALIFFLFGDTNDTARLGVALFGSALVALPYLIRRELGRVPALLAAGYLVISPAFLYVGRFIRHDTYAVVFELLAFIGIVRYVSTRQTRWLYLNAAALSLMLTTMETFFLYVAIFGSLLTLVFLWRVWRPGIFLAAAVGLAVVALVFVLPGRPKQAVSEAGVERLLGPYTCPSEQNLAPPYNPIVDIPGPILGLPPLPTADNAYALCVRHQPDGNFGVYFAKLSEFFGHPAILLALLTSLIGLGALYALIWRRRGRDSATIWQRARSRADGILDAYASLTAGRRLLAAAAIFGAIYTLFFTAFFTNPTGVVSGTTGSLLYWLAQHGVQRGGQPGYYYLVMLFVYEPLLLMWGLAGLAMVGVMIARRLRRRGDHGPAAQAAIDWDVMMPVLLAWWSITTFALYSWAGEKMPWLTIHVALPLVLLAAWAFGRVLRWWQENPATARSAAVESHDAGSLMNGRAAGPAWSARWPAGWPLLIYLGIFGVIAVFAFLEISVASKPSGAQQWLIPILMLLALILFVLLTIAAAALRGRRWAIGALAIAVTMLGALYSVRSAYQVSYRWGDVPREMLIFTQTSPDIARVIARLEQASMRRGGDMDLPIWYDNETVWQWYLRRFSKAQQQSPQLTAPPPADVMAVLMLQENLDAYPQNLQHLEGFRIQRYPLRWWFPEQEVYRLPAGWAAAPLNQRSPLLMRLLRDPTDGYTLAQLWEFMIYRNVPERLGSTDFVIAVRPELVNEIGIGVGAGDAK